MSLLVIKLSSIGLDILVGRLGIDHSRFARIAFAFTFTCGKY